MQPLCHSRSEAPMTSIRSILALSLLLTAPLSFAQIQSGAQSGAQMPPDYRGPQVRIPGIFVTPVSGAPFTAKVEILSTQVLPDGTTTTHTTVNHIARDSRGRIYNERRRLVPTTFQGEPPLLSAHIYDPSTRLSIFTDPFTRLARETTLPHPPHPQANPNRPRPTPPGAIPDQDLGTQYVSGVPMQGIRKSRLIPAAASSTGKDVTISDEYWYSPDLSIYMLIKHQDVRSGTQFVAVSQVERHEPDPAWFLVPTNSKVVDETPPPQEAAAFNR
jgi:hypothetical protein